MFSKHDFNYEVTDLTDVKPDSLINTIIDNFSGSEGTESNTETFFYNGDSSRVDRFAYRLLFNLSRLITSKFNKVVSDIHPFIMELNDFHIRLIKKGTVIDGVYLLFDNRFYNLNVNPNAPLTATLPPTGRDPVLEIFPPTLKLYSIVELEQDISRLVDLSFSCSRTDLDRLLGIKINDLNKGRSSTKNLNNKKDNLLDDPIPDDPAFAGKKE